MNLYYPLTEGGKNSKQKTRRLLFPKKTSKSKLSWWCDQCGNLLGRGLMESIIVHYRIMSIYIITFSTEQRSPSTICFRHVGKSS